MGIFTSSKQKRQKEMLEEQARQLVADQAASRHREEQLRKEIERREQEDIERRRREIEREEQEAGEAELRQWYEEQDRLRELDRVNMQMARLRNTSPESLRRLRELIRARYQLDVEVWGLRGVHRADQGIVMDKGKRADAILQEIYSIVDTWEENTFTPEEWRVARRIKEQVFAPDKRIWEKNPPWN